MKSINDSIGALKSDIAFIRKTRGNLRSCGPLIRAHFYNRLIALRAA